MTVGRAGEAVRGPDGARAIPPRPGRSPGARGLQAVVKNVMRGVLFDVPSRDDVRETVVTAEAGEEGAPPLLLRG